MFTDCGYIGVISIINRRQMALRCSIRRLVISKCFVISTRRHSV